MSHDVHWLKPNRVLSISYQGYQTPETLKACLDEMAAYLDTVTQPVALIISWLEVTGEDPGVLRSNLGHRTYSHPMAARGVLVGFNPLQAMENEVSSVQTRGGKNTYYCKTMDEAMYYLEAMLAD